MATDICSRRNPYSASVSGPIRPTNITKMMTNLPIALSSPVAPINRPTVAKSTTAVVVLTPPPVLPGDAPIYMNPSMAKTVAISNWP